VFSVQETPKSMHCRLFSSHYNRLAQILLTADFSVSSFSEH
jgi:hypothetical protein